MRTFSGKVCTENQNTHFMLNKFLAICALGTQEKKTDINVNDIFDLLQILFSCVTFFL